MMKMPCRLAVAALVLACLSLIPVSAFVAATDDFNRADALNLGGNYTATTGNVRVFSNTARPLTGSSYDFVRRTGETFTGDHYSQAVFVSGGADYELTVRHQSNGDLYLLMCHSGIGFRIYKYISASFTQLGVDLSASPPVAGHVYRLAVEGTTLRAYDNGAQIGTDRTDATLSGGAPGLGGADAATGGWDDWEGGDIGGASTPCRLMLLGVGCDPLATLVARASVPRSRETRH